MQPEGPAAFPWAEKVRRMANVLRDDDHYTGDTEQAERLAERLLVVMGDANV